jgi:hypothetical protein
MISLSKFFASGGEIREWRTGFRSRNADDKDDVKMACPCIDMPRHFHLDFDVLDLNLSMVYDV